MMGEYKIYADVMPISKLEVEAVVRANTQLSGEALSISYRADVITCLVGDNFIEILRRNP
jgi:hypothetical protein